MVPDYITLHSFRWPYAAARAAIYLAVGLIIGVLEPSGQLQDAPRSSAAQTFELFNRDIVVEVRHDAVFVAHHWYSDAHLGQDLAWLKAHNPRSRLVLRLSVSDSFGRARAIVIAAQAAGYRRITIETGPWRPLFLRRLQSPGKIRLDASEVVQPPDEGGMSFNPDDLWE